MMQRKQIQLLFALVLILILAPAIAAQKRAGNGSSKAKEESLSAVVWRDPGDMSTLNLLYGAGGKEHAPDPNGRFTFVEEDLDGGSPKFNVQDEKGVQWKVKLGEETQSETAATRMLWAAGYFVDEDYYLADLKVEGLPKLRRGQSRVTAGGTVQRARMERNSRNIEKLGNWDWFHNQCGSTRELNGLRVMMAFVNNWDLKAVNNSLQEADGQRRCAVTDLGATFGKTGNVIGRSKSTAKEYATSKFISEVTAQSVDLVMHTRPLFLTVFNFPAYRARTRMQKITKRIPLADARWVGQRLALLSVNQIHDSFRAAGYTPEQVDVYTKAVQSRIAELNAL
jgi:hypothetical protein